MTNDKKLLQIASRYIPAGSVKVEHSLGTCYLQDTTAGPQAKPYFTVIAYTGNAGKKTFYEGYRTAELRDQRVADFFAGLEESAASRTRRQAERTAPHTMKPGDIIHHSWGWEQTQCDFYQVLFVTQHGATIQAIGAYTVSTAQHGMADTRMPNRDGFCGEPMKVRIDGRNYVTTLKHGSASLWDGRAQYCSWYG